MTFVDSSKRFVYCYMDLGPEVSFNCSSKSPQHINDENNNHRTKDRNVIRNNGHRPKSNAELWCDDAVAVIDAETASKWQNKTQEKKTMCEQLWQSHPSRKNSSKQQTEHVEAKEHSSRDGKKKGKNKNN